VADVVGYSRLVGVVYDEGKPFSRVRHSAKTLLPQIAEHRGRIVKNTGVVFVGLVLPSPWMARCAVEISRHVRPKRRGADLPPDGNRISDRVFISATSPGDENDIFGDGSTLRGDSKNCAPREALHL